MSSGGLHYWKDGRDVPDLLIGLFLSIRRPRSIRGSHVSLRVNFRRAAGDTSGFRFIGTDGVLNVSVRGTISLQRRQRDTAPGHSASTFSKATE